MPVRSACAFPSNEAPGPGAWTHDPAEPDDEGPGLLVSPAFWAGGALSLVLWAAVAGLVARWV